MKFFYDTEFIEDGNTIDLISIGMIDDKNNTFYAVNKECDFSKSNDWVLENVLIPIGLDRRGFNISHYESSDNKKYQSSLSFALSKKEIGLNLMKFVKNIPTQTTIDYYNLHSLEVKEKIEFWGYYSDYDHVALCQLFGRMIDLPVSFPMFTHDIKQLCSELGDPELPKQLMGEHNALNDAMWNKEVYRFLVDLKKNYKNKK